MTRFPFLLAFMTACSSVRGPHDAAHSRAALLHMATALKTAAIQCTAQAKWLSSENTKFGSQSESIAEGLASVCMRNLIPARDAVYAAAEQADPWTAASSGAIACAAKTTDRSLTNIRYAVVLAGGQVPSLVDDGILLGKEYGAGATCDPESPTTTVLVEARP